MITWVKVHDNIKQARTVTKDGQLSIINAEKKDSGLYKCKASNHLGHISAVTQLNVVQLPRFTVRPPSQLEVSTKQNITVRCQATGDPPPRVMWMKENGQLPVGRSKARVDGTMEMWNLMKEDSGKYTCVAASNEIFAKAISTMELTVKKTGKNEFQLNSTIPCTRWKDKRAYYIFHIHMVSVKCVLPPRYSEK